MAGTQRAGGCLSCQTRERPMREALSVAPERPVRPGAPPSNLSTYLLTSSPECLTLRA